MLQTSATIRIAAPASRIYQYLRNRYDGEVFRNAFMATKGYVPQIKRIEDLQNEKLTFYVSGRDSLTQIRTGSWTWGYEIRMISEAETEVRIWYRWSVFMSIMSLWTIHHQASNELAETAMALDALARSDK